MLTGGKILGMKIKTSVSLSEELLQAVNAQPGSRSEFLEAAAWERLRRQAREQRDKRDVELLNQYADFLNAETADAMLDQADI